MPDNKKTAGKSGVVVSIGDAARDLARQKRRRADPPPAIPRGEHEDVKAGQWTADRYGMPSEDPCPVQVLGLKDDLVFLIDSSGVFKVMSEADFTHARMQGLFKATPHWPQWSCPRFGRAKAEGMPPPIESFKDDALRELLFKAADRHGLFDPAEKMRGRGCWALKGGQILYHAGEELWIAENGRIRVRETGVIEGYLYPRLAEMPAPWTEPVSAGDNPTRELVGSFRKFNWTRPKIDPILLLGWIGIAYFGGALDWRSSVMLIGDAGTGKSTLQNLLRDLFGEALFRSGDTTAAGIYQSLKQDSRPVAVDELEAEADARKVNAVVKLMRIAASGDDASRGGSDHQATSFTLRSAFLFSAINNPIQSSQDLSRVAVLRLRPFDPNQAAPAPIDADTCGRKVLARLMTQWERFEETRAEYMKALAAGGHSGRGQKTYGTLLAAADLMLGSELAAELGIPLTEDLAWWSEHLGAETLPEIEDALPNWRKVISYLLGVQVPSWRSGTRQTVGQALEELGDGSGDYTPQMATRDLANAGIGLTRASDVIGALARKMGKHHSEAEAAVNTKMDAGWILAVPNEHPQITALFQGSQFTGTLGSAGPWKDAMRMAPGPDDGPPVVITDARVNRVRVGGVQLRCSLVVLKHFHESAER